MKVSTGKRTQAQRTLDSVRQAADSFIAGLETGKSAREMRPLGGSVSAGDSVNAYLRDSCDFVNRFGGYSGHVLKGSRQFGTVDVLLYDYSLGCGKRRFLLAYQVRPRIDLVMFRILREDADDPLVEEIRRSTSKNS